ncbi:hypothetical protein ACIBLA_08805 [Streptomyces sp. NPDC050433]|uniref:hypothetical protein n=1 Tax=Streptomyces sp. NPDC050433 TaxID=3365615 RepID=UPI00379170CD
MSKLAEREPEYAKLIEEFVGELTKWRRGPRGGELSDRKLAAQVRGAERRAGATPTVGVSPSTIGAWLRAERFPQRIEQLLDLVEAVEDQVKKGNKPLSAEQEAVLHKKRWNDVYAAVTGRRADGTRSAVEAAQARKVRERLWPGPPLAEVTDALQLQVHESIGSAAHGLPLLPRYVPRDHDRRLAEVVAGAADGTSAIAVLVGGSSTGKTRACWEALNPLRERKEPWRLWHPLYPAHAGAAQAELTRLAPYTVVWLDEAQSYLAGGDGETVAADLRKLLRDQARGPVLILATLWPAHLRALTDPRAPDAHRHAHKLLEHHRIHVPDAFTGPDLAALRATDDDPRLREAADAAPDGQVTQYLAGVPLLRSRYEMAPPASRALVQAAMDARRLGAGAHLPLAWLTAAAPHYPEAVRVDVPDEGWQTEALGYVTAPCNGIPGILTAVGTPRNQRTHATAGSGAPAGQGELYRLADHLDQDGRRSRAEEIPPVGFWTTAARHAPRSDLAELGHAAWNRGLYRDAAQLLKHAAAQGHPQAAIDLVRRLHALHPDDHRPAEWAAAAFRSDDPHAKARLLDTLREAGAEESVIALLERHPAAETSQDDNPFPLDDLYEVTRVLEVLRDAGETEQITALAKHAADNASLHAPVDAGMLLDALREAGETEQVALLARRAVREVRLGDPDDEDGPEDPDNVAERLDYLLVALRRAGEVPEIAAPVREQMTVLLGRAVRAVRLNNLEAVGEMLKALTTYGTPQQVTALAKKAAAEVSVRKPGNVAGLLYVLRDAGEKDQVTALLDRDPATKVFRNRLGDVAWLLRALREAGEDPHFADLARAQITTLLKRCPATKGPLDDAYDVAWLLDALRETEEDPRLADLARAQITALLDRDPATQVDAGHVYAVADLLRALWEAGETDQFDTLVGRATVAVCADIVSEVAHLLGELRKYGTPQQVTTLAKKAAAEVSVRKPGNVAGLLDVLREVEERDQAIALARRADVEIPSLTDPSTVHWLLRAMKSVGAEDAAGALAARTANALALGSRHSADAVARMLEALREADTGGAVDILLDRAPAAEVDLDNLYHVALLLDVLRKAGADDQLTDLATRAVNDAFLNGSHAVAELLTALRKADAHAQIATLAERLPGAGHFDQFIEIGGAQGRFRFGREPDGTDSTSWNWDDLE